MAKNNVTANKKGTGNNRKKSGIFLIIAAAAALCAVIAIMAVPKVSSQGDISSDADSSAKTASDTGADEKNVQVIEAGESLIIPISEISSAARFYTVEVDGTEMEIIAVMDSDGNIRTAFNTCQICYSSGRGYYVQKGNMLICQNCGNIFTVDQVEIESGGCNPWPIFPENKTVTDDAVEISYDFLRESKEIFANWKLYY